MAFDFLSLLPLVGKVGETLLNKQSQGKRTADLNEILNRQMADYGLGRETIFGKGEGSPGMFSNLADPTLTDFNRQIQALYGGEGGGQFGRLNDLISRVFNPESISQAYGGQDPYGQNTPGLQNALSQFQSLIPQLQGQSGLASQVFQGGGWTPQSQAGFDAISPIMSGQTAQQQGLTNMANNIFGTNGENALSSVFRNAAAKGISGTNPLLDFASGGAQKIFGQQGQTDATNQGIGAAQGLFANGGFNPTLNTLAGYGGSTLAQGGLTPTGALGEQAALDVLSSGGATRTTDALQNRGVDLASRESLLPLDKVLDFARNEAGTAFQNNMEAARRQALSRGGGAGSNVASGLANEGLADYSDRGAQLQADAVQKALLGQQGLQLQQAGLGANMAQQGGALENNRFGTAASTLTGLEGVAANRFGTGGSFLQGANSGAAQNANIGLDALGNLAGLQSSRELGALGLLPGISNAGVNQAGVFGNLGLGSGAQDLDRVNSAAQMYNSVLNSQLGGANANTGLFGQQGQYALGAGRLANEGTNDIASIIQQMLGGNLAASGQGLSRTNAQFGQNQTGIQNQFGQQGFSAGQQNQAAGNYGSLLNSLLGWMTGQGNAGNVTAYQNANPGQNPWGPIFNAGLTGAAGAFGGFGGGNNP